MPRKSQTSSAAALPSPDAPPFTSDNRYYVNFLIRYKKSPPDTCAQAGFEG